MSFIRKAQEAAEAARAKVEEAAASASRSVHDPSTADRINRGLADAGQGARDAVGMARRGVTTVIERIDPGTLADLIVKATALQEMTNKALRQKGSPYRISEISIAASIPPGVTFTIGRVDRAEEVVSGDVLTSEQLVDQAPSAGDVVLALDGATIDQAAATAIDEAAVASPTAPPNATGPA